MKANIIFSYLRMGLVGTLISLGTTTTLQAADITASGVAPLELGETAARELAIQDALRQAALSQHAFINSTEVIQQGNYHESGSLTSAPLQGKVTVLNEYRDKDLYHVNLSVNTTQSQATSKQRASKQSTSAITASSQKQDRWGCPASNARELRRRLVTTYFTLAQPAQASDLTDLATQLPVEIAARFNRLPLYRANSAGEIGVVSDLGLNDPAAGAESVRRLGHQGDVQFVISGRVNSTAVTSRSLRATLFESWNTSQQGVYYNGPLSGLTGGAIKYAPNERQFDADIWVYDALTGSAIAHERVSTLAHGKVVRDDTLPFASAAFWSTDYGKSIDNALTDVVTRINQRLACIPFSAHIVYTDAQDRLYINAGKLDGLEVGDRLLVYQAGSPNGLRSVSGNPQLGVPESLIGDITILQVQPELAIATMRGNKKAQIGNIVRFVAH